MTDLRRVGLALAFLCALAASAASQSLPELNDTVNDFAGIIDPQHRAALDEVIRALQAASGDVIVVATASTVAPYADVREYAVKLFENNGRGIGERGKDNGLLVLVAVQERRVWIEVGYGLEQWITDGFAGETTRDAMTPEFRSGRYGAGLLAGVTRLAARIAEGRQVQLRGIAPQRAARPRRVQIPLSTIIVVFILIVILSRMSGGPGRPVSRWGRRGWSGWSGGVGPFGGGGGGGFGGGSGGFGGGFGGFGGGRSGGGGGGGGW